MKRDYFDDCQELAEYMVDKAQDGFYTVAVLFYKEANELLRELLFYEDVEAESIVLEPCEYNGYSKEFYVSIADDMVVSVEPAFVDGRYLNASADILLIDNEANSKIIVDLDERKCREIYVGERQICNYDCATCDYYETEDEDDNYELECEELLDKVFENAEIYKDEDGNPTKIKFDVTPIFDWLFD